jgi:hypothetical protein
MTLELKQPLTARRMISIGHSEPGERRPADVLSDILGGIVFTRNNAPTMDGQSDDFTAGRRL